MSKPAALTVYYDGSCPLCALEIEFYRRRAGAGRISWIDASRVEPAEFAPGLSRTQALARFHAVTAQGTILSGAEAFARIWSLIPGFRIIGNLYRFRPLAWLMERAYNGFLLVRPTMQRLVRRREKI